MHALMVRIRLSLQQVLPKSTTQARSLVLLASSIHEHQCTASQCGTLIA
jgi:hypothetical protein